MLPQKVGKGSKHMQRRNVCVCVLMHVRWKCSSNFFFHPPVNMNSICWKQRLGCCYCRKNRKDDQVCWVSKYQLKYMLMFVNPWLAKLICGFNLRLTQSGCQPVNDPWLTEAQSKSRGKTHVKCYFLLPLNSPVSSRKVDQQERCL